MESISNYIAGSTLVRSIKKYVRSSWSTVTNREINYLPKEDILKAFRDHRLILRAISPAAEVEYLLEGSDEPRPGYLIQEGTPVHMRAGDLTVGILNSEALALYKKNASTCALQCGGERIKPDHLHTKCLPDIASLSDKMRERARHKWEVHSQQFTSGHLRADGTFSLPKPRRWPDNCAVIPHSELLTCGYKLNQLIFICINQRDMVKDVGPVLTAKKKLEQNLSIPPLPVVVYSEKNGNIDIHFSEELADAEVLTEKESQLNDFCLSRNVVPTLIRNLLALLPLDIRTKVLAESSLTTSSAFAQHKRELLSLLSDPELYNPDRLAQLVADGFPVKSQLYYQNGFNTPLDLLIWTDRRRCISDMTAVEVCPKTSLAMERKAIKMFRILVAAGAWMSDYTKEEALSGLGTSSGLINLLKAMGLTSQDSSISKLLSVDLNCCPGAVIEIDERCRRMSDARLQESLVDCLTHQCKEWSRHSCTTLDSVRTKLLALFYHGAVVNEEVVQRFEMEYDNFESLFPVPGNYSMDRHIQWIKALWKGRRQDEGYRCWPQTVEQARNAIAAFTIPRNTQAGLSRARLLREFDFLIRAFKTRPNLAQAHNNNQTIEKILGHYYRRPGLERIIALLGETTIPKAWKPQHSSSHVLRVRNNALWFMELLESCQLDAFTDDEKTVLALASIYLDAAAEEVSEALRAMETASYFLRDLRGQYSAELVGNVSMALRDINCCSHNVCDPVARYRRVLRFANSLDSMRSYGVGEQFPLDSKTGNSEQFNPLGALDTCLISELRGNTQFRRHLTAAMHGAADLAFVTGELKHDQRPVPFGTRYQLKPDNMMLCRQFEWTQFPVVEMDEFIDSNVRRAIAARAGIYTCSDPRHSRCRSDRKLGVTHGIHNSAHELSQVRVPPAMTRLEKMQCGHDLSLLSPLTRSSIAWEVKRLRSKGIAMSLGTLTQQTLASPAARAALRRRGIEVGTEYRMRGRDQQGNPSYEQMLVPKPLDDSIQ